VWLTSIKATKGDCIADRNTPSPVPELSNVLNVSLHFIYCVRADCISFLKKSRTPCQSFGRSSNVLRHGLVLVRILTVIEVDAEKSHLFSGLCY